MQSYILRRMRWWSLLKQLDPSVVMSTEVLGDMLLDAAKVIDWQRQLILTSTGHSTGFAAVEAALMEQLGQIQLTESRPGRDYNYPSSGSKGYGVDAHITEIIIMVEKILSVRWHTSQGATTLNPTRNMMMTSTLPMKKHATMMMR